MNKSQLLQEKKGQAWYLFPEDYRLAEDVDQFESDWRSISVRVFVNKETGEVKLFSKTIVSKLGSDTILKKLNK